MIGIVVVSHGHIAENMVNEMERIIPETSGVVAVNIDSNQETGANRQLIAAAIREVNRGDGVLLITDMFGGTPSNLCLSFLGQTAIEVVSGVNMPMLLKLAGHSRICPLADLAEFIKHYGQKNIVIASHILKGNLT